MTILLYNDGRLVIDQTAPLEGVTLDNLAMFAADARPGDVLTFNGTFWQNGAANLITDEVSGEGDAVQLDKTYAQIKAAVDAGQMVIIRSESSGTYTLTPLATYGGDDDTGYTVTAGSDTYTSSTVDGALVKEAGGEG